MPDVGTMLEDLASSSPTPGGGSVAALSGALGAALVSMVCNLTIGKKKYADVEDEMKATLCESESLRLELAQLVDEDANAFDRVMAAMKLPKDTDEEKEARKVALEAALVDAASVPMAVMGKAVDVIGLAERAADKGNTNAVSDAGVAALMARSGAQAARLNVLINLGGIRREEHKDFVEQARARLGELSALSDELADRVLRKVLEKIS
jgi:formiminotetrahydrofolate cyclodeaminase